MMYFGLTGEINDPSRDGGGVVVYVLFYCPFVFGSLRFPCPLEFRLLMSKIGQITHKIKKQEIWGSFKSFKEYLDILGNLE